MLAHTMRTSGFISGFQQLSRAQQVILAECLERGFPEVTVLSSDPHADRLSRTGWLHEEVAMTPGTRTFSVPAMKWREIAAIKDQILTPGMRAEIETWRRNRASVFGQV